MVYQPGESGQSWTDLYQADQNCWTKTFLYFIFSKSSDETFCCSKDRFRGHFNLRRRVKTACFQIQYGANGMWNWNTKINKSNINTFKFHLFMVSSNDWEMLLISINLRYLMFVLHHSYCKIFGNFVSEVLFPAF